MNIGMLWFDNDATTTFSSKVEEAVGFYKKKYGKTPTLCYVSRLPPDHGVKIIEVRLNKDILPGHFWIGMKE